MQPICWQFWFMDANEVRRLLEVACKDAGGVSEFARSISVSREFVRLVLVGKRPPTTPILDKLKLEAVTSYQRKETR